MVLGSIILCGLGLQLARRQWVIPLYVLLSIAAICLTPWPIQLVRYSDAALSIFCFSILYFAIVSESGVAQSVIDGGENRHFFFDRVRD